MSLSSHKVKATWNPLELPGEGHLPPRESREVVVLGYTYGEDLIGG